MKIFFRLISFSKPYKNYIPEYVVYVFLFIVFGIINFSLLIPLLDVLFDTKKQLVESASLPKFSLSVKYAQDCFYYFLSKYAKGNSKLDVLVFVCVVIVLFALLKNLFGYLSQRVLTRMRVNLVKNIRQQLFNKFANQDLSFYATERKGDLLATISGDVVEIENIAVSSIQTLFKEPLMLISTFVVLFIISKELTFFTLVFFPISGFLIAFISKKLRKKSTFSQNILGNLLNISEETLSGIRIIKTFNAEKFVSEKYAAENSNLTRLLKSMTNQRELASPVSEFLGILVVSIIIIYGGYLILNGQSQFTAAQFITYIAFYFQIITPVKNISGAITYMQKGLAAGKRVIRIIDSEQSIFDKPNATEITTFNKDINFSGVSFKYNTGENVLSNINLSIAKGKMVALVGASGAGKSTLVDLIPRFYEATEGTICIDDKNINNLSLKSLRGLISMVSQEAILFNDTILNNIKFGMPNATDEEVIAAAKVANAHQFITQLPNGYNTIVGDRGVLISGGQRQRLTIARAVIKNAPILILDEATSALDSESEKLVQEALEKLMQNRTSIVIAHRLSTIKNADEIIVMNKGEIIERGSHDNLINQQGIYSKLVTLQEIK